MAYPEPVPGLVIRYSYLWYREHLEGQEEGAKDRPCAIVAAIRVHNGDLRVLVLPITHSEPDRATVAIEIPPPVQQRAGLDDERSWVVVDEYNEFVWPGPDLRRASPADDSSIAFGRLPKTFFEVVRRALLARITDARGRSVRRTQ